MGEDVMIGDGRQRGRGAAADAAKDAAVERHRTVGGQRADGEMAAVEEGAPPMWMPEGGPDP
jgi:hypothetical protein